MRRCALVLVIMFCCLPSRAQSYTTNFPATENPISQGGKWTNGLATGFDWGNVQTTGGAAYGTTISVGPPYNDSIATIKGTWGLNQTVTGTVVGCSGANIGVFKEISIFLRFTISAHNASGLGADWSCENANNGLPITSLVPGAGLSTISQVHLGTLALPRHPSTSAIAPAMA